MGLKVGTISKYEQGIRTPDIGMLIAISKAVDWDISYLIAPNRFDVPKNPFEPSLYHYVEWLRHVGVGIDVAYFECGDGEGYEGINGNNNTDDNTGNVRFEFRVDIDGATLDITGCLEKIMV